jgi:small-conductance mechanosensitive channel
MTATEIINYELFTVGSTSITVSMVVTVFLIFVATQISLSLFKRFLNPFFRRRNIEVGRQKALFQLIKYLVWVVAIALTLEFLGFKITLLIAGSAALLVGLGLGLQQIFQDLVSGIFILIEGTIREADVIEIDGLVGKILIINLRTSQVLSRDGIVIIVPNHKFINENIINWSHSSQATRFKVSVSVAYGTDVEKVRTILVQCASLHLDVLKETNNDARAPFSRLVDFGDNGIHFELFFWTTNIFRVESTKSDIRFEINKKFNTNGIVIPFPQRDVHMIKGD